jgi:hypothetical protein
MKEDPSRFSSLSTMRRVFRLRINRELLRLRRVRFRGAWECATPSKPLANARGSDRSHDRKGMLSRLHRIPRLRNRCAKHVDA